MRSELRNSAVSLLLVLLACAPAAEAPVQDPPADTPLVTTPTSPSIVDSTTPPYDWFTLDRVPSPGPVPFVVDDQALPLDPDLVDPEFDSLGHQVVTVEFVEPDRGDVWVAAMDPATGEIIPGDGRGERIGDRAASVTRSGNGPEWLYSERGPEVLYAYVMGPSPRIVRAWQDAGGWEGEFVPGSEGLLAPLGSLDPDDPEPRLVSRQEDALRAWWRFIDDPEDQLLVDADMPRSPRWVPGTHDAVFAAPDGELLQTFVLDADTGTIEQLTDEPTGVGTVYMWFSPSLGETIFFGTLLNEDLDAIRMAVFQQIDDEWQIVKTIEPPVDFPFIGSPEYFVYEGRSYIFYSTCSEPLRSLAVRYEEPGIGGACGDSRIWITGAEPDNHVHRMISAETEMTRNDPEAYVTDQGALVYYTDAPGGGLHRCATGL